MKSINISILFIVLILFVGGVLMNCENQKIKRDKGVYFFKGCNLYKLPAIPSEEISDNEIGQYSTYYEAVYNDKNNLVKLTKYLNKKVYFTYEYIYDDKNNIIEYTIIKGNDSNKTQRYNKNGDLIN